MTHTDEDLQAAVRRAYAMGWNQATSDLRHYLHPSVWPHVAAHAAGTLATWVRAGGGTAAPRLPPRD